MQAAAKEKSPCCTGYRVSYFDADVKYARYISVSAQWRDQSADQEEGSPDKGQEAGRSGRRGRHKVDILARACYIICGDGVFVRAEHGGSGTVGNLMEYDDVEGFQQ
jgi:hypothetical protein